MCGCMQLKGRRAGGPEVSRPWRSAVGDQGRFGTTLRGRLDRTGSLLLAARGEGGEKRILGERMANNWVPMMRVECRCREVAA